MDKELELFKRWFGWDPSKFSVFHKVEMAYLPVTARLYNPGTYTAMYEEKHSLEIKHKIAVLQFYEMDYRKLDEIGIPLDYLYEVVANRGDRQLLELLYKIPPQYHSEWEQYVNEKEGK